MEGFTKRQEQRGYGLVEAAIVLGVVAVVIGGIWTVSAAVMESYKVNKTIDGILTIARNIQNLISLTASSAIGNVRLTENIISGAIPSDWIKGNEIKNPFGGAVYIYNSLPTGGFNNTFDVRLVGVPESACIKLISKISSVATPNSGFDLGNGLGYIAAYDAGGLKWGSVTFPVSVDEAKTACSGSVSYFRFRFGYTRIN